jgi:hypothetical protein
MIAPPLAAAGVKVAWCERVALVLEGPALEPGLEWVASTLSAATLLSELKDSSRRISELVAAIKSYSQMDRASVQHINVTDGIESTLLMLGYKLRDGITVVRDYSADVPRIQAYPGELNQVWTNLIDAMAGAGTLRLSTRAEGNDVVIEVGDTGLVCRRRWLPARSRPFTRPRTWAKAPVWASTSHGASSWSATVARSPSTPDQAKRCCESASPSGRQCPGGKRPADPVGAEYTVRAGQELPDTLRANRRADHARGRDQQLEITEPGLYRSKSRDGVLTCMFAGSAKLSRSGVLVDDASEHLAAADLGAWRDGEWLVKGRGKLVPGLVRPVVVDPEPLWGSRTVPLALTWAFRRPPRIR